MIVFLIFFALVVFILYKLFDSKPASKWTAKQELKYREAQQETRRKTQEKYEDLLKKLNTGFTRAINDLEVRFIFIDFETTDLPIDNRVPAKSELTYYPHIVQAAMLIFNSKHELIDEFVSIIKVPEVANFSPSATKIHNITKERCQNEGKEIECFFDLLKKHLSPHVCLISHNIQFDNQLLKIEAKRFGFKLPKYQMFCTMKSTKDDVGVFKYNSYSYKMPKLKELVHYAFLDGSKEEFDFNFHDAYTDIKLCAMCFYQLKLYERIDDVEY